MKKLWEDKKLGDVIELEYGKPLPDSKRKAEGAYPVYGANGEKDRTDEYYHDKKSIIVGRKGSAGEINLTENKFWPLDVTYFVTFDDKKHDLKFLYYLLSNLELPKLAKGVKPGINRNEVYSITVRIPSLPEQQRIASHLDETFSAIVIAKENAERNLRNSRDLFKSHLQIIFSSPGERWELVKLSELTTDITDGDHLPPPKSATGVPFITISNIDKGSNKIDFSSTFKVPYDYFKKIKMSRRPMIGDVLYTVTGSFGIPVIIDSDLEFCFQRHIGLIRPKAEIDSKWLYYWLMSPEAMRQAENVATGAAQKTVSLNTLRNFTVPLIPISEQIDIVSKLDVLSTETKKLETIYQQKLADLNELKKSILKKAFNGELSGAN